MVVLTDLTSKVQDAELRDKLTEEVKCLSKQKSSDWPLKNIFRNVRRCERLQLNVGLQVFIKGGQIHPFG